MANIAPLFNSAPRLKLRINQVAVAYAVGFDISITINNVPVRTIGDYAVIAIEPVLYNGVRGTMQILELKPLAARNALITNASALPSDMAPNRNVTTVDTQVVGNSKTSVQNSGSLLNLQGLGLQLDPEKVLLSSTFDIEVYVKYPDSTGNMVEVKQFTIQDCRLTTRAVNISAGSLIDIPFGFVGNLFIDNLRPGGQNAVEMYDVGIQE